MKYLFYKIKLKELSLIGLSKCFFNPRIRNEGRTFFAPFFNEPFNKIKAFFQLHVRRDKSITNS